MGLLSTDQVRAIYKLATASNLAVVRDMLWVDFDPATVATTKAQPGTNSTADDLLRLDLSNLNNNLGRTAEGNYLLQIWLETCALRLESAEPAKAQQFRDWIARINTLPVQPEPNAVEDAGTLRNELSAPVVSDAAIKLAAELEGFIDGLAANSDRLLRAKRLHDKLHELQTGALPILRRLGGIGNSLAPFAALILNTLDMVSSAASFATNQVVNAPPTDSLRVLAETLAKDLQDAAARARQAVADEKADEYRAALTTLRERIKDGMSNVGFEIDRQLDSMEPGQPQSLEELGLKLRRLASEPDDSKVRAAAASAVQSVGVIAQNLWRIGRRHHDWQSLDAQLWLLEDMFDQMLQQQNVGILFNSLWGTVIKSLNDLAGTPKGVRATQIDELVAKFVAVCPLPPTLPVSPEAADSFSSLVGEARKAFREVDLNLQASCDQLAAITALLVL